MISVSVLALGEPTEATSSTLRLVPPRKRLRSKAVAVEPTRERILSAAAQVFAEYGFTGASMPAVAAQSGITAGAIYRHFASKAELLLEVVKRALEALPFSFERSSGKEDTALLPEVAARLTDPAFTLLRRLSMDTLHPQLVGDRAWREFVASHVAALLGLNTQKVRRKLPTQGRVSVRDARPGAKEERKQEG
jgi:AcrR family transcriptional regulator